MPSGMKKDFNERENFVEEVLEVIENMKNA
jgi:hypothetical protein